jgi:hypothetical protein
MSIMKVFSRYMEKFVSIAIYRGNLKIDFQYDKTDSIFSKLRYLQRIKDFIYELKIKLDEHFIFDALTYPNDFHVELNGNFVYNQDLNQIVDLSFGMVKVISFIIPNIYQTKRGRHEIMFQFREKRFMFTMRILEFDEKLEFPPSSKIEPIGQQAEALISTEEKAKNYLTKLRKTAILVGVLVYLAVSAFLVTATISAALDPIAHQLDVVFSSVLALVVWTLLWVAIFIFTKIIKKKTP